MKQLLVISALCALSLQSFAFSNEGRGGGDDIAFEFQQALLSAVQETNSHEELSQVLIKNKITETAAKAQIVIVDDALEVSIKNLVQNSVAVNIPAEQKILINRQRWNQIQDPRIRRAIALHEVLSLKNIEQTGFYPYSTKYLNLVGASADALDNILRVDRLKQLTAEGLTPKETLVKFFNEARETLTIMDLPEYSKIESLGFRCLRINQYNAGLTEHNFGRFTLQSSYDDSQDWGPLFPPNPKVKDVFRIRDATSLPSATEVWRNSTLNATPTEIIQTFSQGRLPFYSKITLRKNNGLLTFNIVWDKSAQNEEVWGYCYFKPPTSSK